MAFFRDLAKIISDEAKERKYAMEQARQLARDTREAKDAIRERQRKERDQEVIPRLLAEQPISATHVNVDVLVWYDATCWATEVLGPPPPNSWDTPEQIGRALSRLEDVPGFLAAYWIHTLLGPLTSVIAWDNPEWQQPFYDLSPGQQVSDVFPGLDVSAEDVGVRREWLAPCRNVVQASLDELGVTVEWDFRRWLYPRYGQVRAEFASVAAASGLAEGDFAVRVFLAMRGLGQQLFGHGEPRLDSVYEMDDYLVWTGVRTSSTPNAFMLLEPGFPSTGRLLSPAFLPRQFALRS